jgi:hypothetical protein
MRRGRAVLTAGLVLCGAMALGSSVPAGAQPAPAEAEPTPGGTERGDARLFQRFVEDAAVVPGAWVEAQYSYENLNQGTRHRAGPIIAFRLGKDVEAGLRFGFEWLSVDGGPDGSGFSDLDIYAKYRFPGAASRFALGALFKAPTGDEENGIGTGSSDIEVFGAFRSDFKAVSLVANAGVRSNGGTDPPFADAQDSFLLGGGILLSATSAATFSVEASYETRRLAGAHADGRLTIGVQTFGPAGRGGFRGAIGIPLTDGAPDLNLLAGVYLVY